MNRKKLLISFIICIMVVIGCLIALLSRKNEYVFDSNSFYEAFEKRFDDLNLHRLDMYDIGSFFGLGYSSDEEVLFMSDFLGTEDNHIFNPNELVIVVDEKNNEDYYDYLLNYVDMQINNLDDTDKINLYRNAIINKNGKVIYYIMSIRQNDINEFIEEYFK